MAPRRVFLGCVCLLVLASAPTLALVPMGPGPPPVCEPCSSGIVGSFPAGEIEHSNATIQVRENGTAVWTIHNRLDRDDDESELQGSDFRAGAVASEALRESDRYSQPDLLNASIDGNTVRMRYRTADFATQKHGVIRVDYLRAGYQDESVNCLGVKPQGLSVDSRSNCVAQSVESDRSRSLPLTSEPVD